jgi:hypothetical protein
MIDFPNTPLDQQIFNGPNGVVYRWIAATSLWQALGVGQQSITVGDTAPANPFNGMMWWNSTLAQLFIYYNDGNSSQWVPASPPATQLLTTPGGDFCAYSSASLSLAVSVVTVGMPNIIYSGNSGGWYNPGNGRFTPPAGRYLLTAGAIIAPGSASGVFVNLRKNGVNLGGASSNLLGAGAQVPGSGTWYGDPQGTAIVDANGTDYFDFTLLTNVAGPAQAAWFAAFPLSGVAGPPGPGNAWRILSRQTPSAVGFVELQAIPADINELDVHFDLLPVTNDQDLACQFYGATGVLDTTSGHYTAVMWSNSHTASMGSNPVSSTSTGVPNTTSIIINYSTATARVSNTAGCGIKGQFSVPNIKSATRKALMGQCYWLDGANTNMRAGSFSGDRAVAEAITGLRLYFGSSSIASGSFEVWGSP